MLQSSGVLGTRLFERLAAPDNSGGDAAETGLAEVVESIKRHLVELLNSHPGHSECAPELGLLDFNDATIGALDLERNIERAIRHCIERFEPRVRQVEVASLPRGSDLLQLRFQIHATVELGRGLGQATIDLVLNDKRYQCLD